jgi:hypothetical protein
MAHRLRRPHQRTQTPTRLAAIEYKGISGMKRWVGLGVIADNLIHISNHMAAPTKV